MSVIQCWNCGTRLTLCERSDNDGDCLDCGVEIALDDYLADAMSKRDALAADNERLREALQVIAETGYGHGGELAEATAKAALSSGKEVV